MYDQIVVPDSWSGHNAVAGIFIYPRAYNWGWAVREQISDHLPVYLILGASDFTLRDYGSTDGLMTAAADAVSAKPPCIRLNVASIDRLDELPHVGPARAEDIVVGRPWDSIGELVDIRGLGDKSVADIVASGLLCEPVVLP